MGVGEACAGATLGVLQGTGIRARKMDDKWDVKRQATPRRKMAAAEGNKNGTRGELLAARWPVLGEALVAHQRNLAATFAEEAYFVWRTELSDRRNGCVWRARERRKLGLRVFDAELIIA